MDKINNNFDLDFSDLLRPILIDFLKYINRCLKVKSTCVVNFARSIYSHIETNLENNIIYDLNNEYGLTINEIIKEFRFVALEFLDRHDFIRYIPQSEIQYLIART